MTQHTFQTELLVIEFEIKLKYSCQEVQVV
jgi:hypothetical protein